jgi:membrane-associated phospholipid phosphatase
VAPLDSARRSQAAEARPTTIEGMSGTRGAAILKVMNPLTSGCVLLAMAAVGGLYFAIWPTSGRIDLWLGYVIPPSHSHWLSSVTWLRYPAVIMAGSAVCAVLCFRRDRSRSCACLVAPPMALVLCELVAKPLVGRTLGGSLSYPSGSTVGAAALATAMVLAAPTRWRLVSLIVAGAYVVWMAVAVVSLQWHYPTDAVGGLAFGAGVVLVVDGLLHRVFARAPGHDGAGTTPSPPMGVDSSRPDPNRPERERQ